MHMSLRTGPQTGSQALQQNKKSVLLSSTLFCYESYDPWPIIPLYDHKAQIIQSSQQGSNEEYTK